MGGYGDGWWLLMWAWMTVLWLLVIAGVWLVWRAQRPLRGSSDAEEILKRRLARGEIDVEQYRGLTRELESSDRTSPRKPSGGHIALLILVVLAVSAVFAAPALAVTRGDWGMFDRMGGMMGDGSNTASAPLTIGGSAETVIIHDLAFSPGNLQVPVGASVTWTNRDSTPHDATSRDGAWTTKTLSTGATGTVRFDRAGEYDYYCSIHPSMKAHLSVK